MEIKEYNWTDYGYTLTDALREFADKARDVDPEEEGCWAMLAYISRFPYNVRHAHK